MDAQALQFEAGVLAIPMAAFVIVCTKWLVASEKIYPRDSFPVTKPDRFRGVVAGVVIAAAWVGGDLVMHGLLRAPGSPTLAWEFRFVMSTLFVVAGRLTFSQIFRILRCRREFPRLDP